MSVPGGLTSTGLNLGDTASQLVGFHGVTPVIQRAGSAQGVYTTTMTQSTGWGFLTSTAAAGMSALLTEIRAVLVEKGIMKGAA